MIPVYVSIAQTLSDLKKYDEAIAYFMKELDCQHGEHKQVEKEHLMLINQRRKEKILSVITHAHLVTSFQDNLGRLTPERLNQSGF